VDILVEYPQTNSPLITIFNPANNAFLSPDLPVALEGTATDPAGQSPLAFAWTVEVDNTKTTVDSGTINSGQHTTFQWTPSKNVSFHCGGAIVEIQLTATDLDGLTESGSVRAYVNYPPC
jgi:hypothetical protein